MTKRLPSINALRSFEAAARHQSFTLAAEELRVSPAAIGYQVKRLEEDLGRALFTRSHRAVRLTPDGMALMRRLGKGFEIIEAAWTEAHAPEPERIFKVTAPIAVVQKWLLHEPTMQTNRFGAADLLQHGLIKLGFDLAAERHIDLWTPWFELQGLRAPDRFEMTCGYTMTAVEVARETGHIAMGGYFVVAEDIAAGRLVAPFPVGIVPQSQLWVMCRKGREEEPEMLWFRQAVRACADRLRATAAGFRIFDLEGRPVEGA